MVFFKLKLFGSSCGKRSTPPCLSFWPAAFHSVSCSFFVLIDLDSQLTSGHAESPESLFRVPYSGGSFVNALPTNACSYTCTQEWCLFLCKVSARTFEHVSVTHWLPCLVTYVPFIYLLYWFAVILPMSKIYQPSIFQFHVQILCSCSGFVFWSFKFFF